jgi:hypothetical protein
VLQVDQGDLLEVETYERTTEGAMMFALTRTKGSSLWLAQGPLLPRGLPSAAAEDGRPVVVWVLPGLQFQAEGEAELEQPEFEIMAVLSNAVFPNSWISTASISAQSIETISKPVPVRVEGYATRSKHRLSIAQVGSQEADAENELTVGTFESVVIDRPETFSEPLKIYLGKHVTGTETWSFVEAIPNGKTHFVPAVQFTNPHPREGAQYQILAIATKGPLPAREVDYHDFLPHIVMSSEILNVRYSSGFFSRLGTFFQGWFSTDAEPGMQTGGTSIMPWILLLTLLTLLLLFAAMMWSFRSNPALAGEIADTLQSGRAAAKKKFELPESINLPYLLLGLTLLAVIVYVIRNYYVSLYTSIVATTTGLAHKQSSDLALWIILVTALAGIFADIGHKQKKAAIDESGKQKGASIYEFIFSGSITIAILLWFFQGLMYSNFLAGTSQSGSLSLAGFGAGLLISITETIAFFIITELTLVPFGWFLLMIILAPLSVGALSFRLVQRIWTHKTPEQKDSKPPPPEPAETAKPADVVEPPNQEIEV